MRAGLTNLKLNVLRGKGRTRFRSAHANPPLPLQDIAEQGYRKLATPLGIVGFCPNSGLCGGRGGAACGIVILRSHHYRRATSSAFMVSRPNSIGIARPYHLVPLDVRFPRKSE